VIDLVHLQVDLAPVDLSDLHRPGGESSHQVAQRVLAARTRQHERSGSGLLNAHLPARDLPQVCCLSDSAQRLLDHAFERLGLTVRALGILLRVARTVADLAGNDGIRPPHVAEAIQLRAHAWFDEPSQQVVQ
jgi:magnesium chelatase family protein